MLRSEDVYESQRLVSPQPSVSSGDWSSAFVYFICSGTAHTHRGGGGCLMAAPYLYGKRLGKYKMGERKKKKLT